MKKVRFTPLSRAALCVSLCGCGADLLVGEQRCYGEGVVCRSDAPTLGMPSVEGIIQWDVIPTRSVEPTWIYDPGSEFVQFGPQLARAPDRGVWLQHSNGTANELLRIDADGEPVELHALNYQGQLSVDDELNPILLARLPSGQLVRTVLDPRGEALDLPVGREPLVTPGKGPTLHFVMAGPEGRVRIAKYNALDYYVAEYDLLGELLWKQSDFRGARLPSTANASYQAIGLSDGSIAVGLPKQASFTDSAGGSVTATTQGITLIGPDGNVRWDMSLTSNLGAVQLFPGNDGSVGFATRWHDSLGVMLLDRDGGQIAVWSAFRAGYHNLNGSTICADPAGDLYLLARTGTRRKPVPTVCRMLASDPHAEVVCLSVPGARQLDVEGDTLTLSPMVAPEPGAVVFSIFEFDPERAASVWRVVRVDF